MKSVFIIAELSGNHHQKLDEALKLIDVAAEAGVDAVKTQTYTADTITIDSDKKYFQVKVNDAWKGQTLHSLYKTAFTPWEWLPKMKARAESRGLAFFSSVFDTSSVDFMEKLGVDFYKVASFEVVDIPLLERIGKTKKPVIMSKGMATTEEIWLALKTLRENGCPDITILQCVSSYPAKPEEMNLLTIPDITRRFKVAAGLSDHTLGNHVAVAAVALGAKVIEKHLTLRRADGGPDAAFSLEPSEFKALVKDVRDIEKAIGKAKYGPGKGEKENIIFRKSLFIVKDMKKGDKFTSKNVRSIRPGHGLAPKFYHSVLGKTAKTALEKGTPLAWKYIPKK